MLFRRHSATAPRSCGCEVRRRAANREGKALCSASGADRRRGGGEDMCWAPTSSGSGSKGAPCLMPWVGGTRPPLRSRTGRVSPARCISRRLPGRGPAGVCGRRRLCRGLPGSDRACCPAGPSSASGSRGARAWPEVGGGRGRRSRAGSDDPRRRAGGDPNGSSLDASSSSSSERLLRSGNG